MDETTPAGKPIVDREKVSIRYVSSLPVVCGTDGAFAQTAPFLIRTFVKVGTYHRLNQFEDGPLPTTDEQQIYTWYVFPLEEAVAKIHVPRLVKSLVLWVQKRIEELSRVDTQRPGDT